jgi:hypothetical protein
MNDTRIGRWLVFRVTTGRIAVYFAGDKVPVLSATDTTLTWGRVGVGSFDETGEFRKFQVTGTRKR